MTLIQAAKKLEAAGVADARFDAAELICHFEKVSRAAAMTGDFSSAELTAALERRAGGEPLQYILGEWDFMGYTFRVNPECLIPRFDTEVLCTYLIENLPGGGTFADLCTGTGCIAVAALLRRPDINRADAVELYPETVKTARENAYLLGVADRVSIIEADVTEDCLTGQYDMIVSNPPYVTAEEMESLSREVKKEPARALTDGGDGLAIIRKIVEIYPAHLKDGGALAIEIGHKQGNALRHLAAQHGLTCEILKDTGDRDRVAVIRKPTVR